MVLRARDVDSASAARQVLDQFGVPARLEHIRQFIWRGGDLRLEASHEDERVTSVFYELAAHWDTAALIEDAVHAGLVPMGGTVLDGRWVRVRTGYILRMGIELGVPSAIFIRSERRAVSFVPFLNRTSQQVEHALDADLTLYVNRFLDTRAPVPRAMAAAAERLRALGL
jgi:hypothetical protein